MMKHPRLLSLLIALVLCLFVGAAGAEANTVVTNMYEFDVQELGFADQDEFFSYYVEQKLYGYEWVTFARPAYDYLTAKQKALYDMVVPTIKSIAAGTRASTIIELDVDAVKAAGFVLDGTYTDENTDLNTNATATWTAIAADFEQVRKALIVDHPFEFYWCHGSGYGYTYSYGGGSYTVYPAFYFFPAENFQPASGYDEEAPTVDTVQTSAVNYAVTKANEIVTKYAGKTDIEKLTGYKDEICALVDYNHDALNGWSASEDNSPWQLLWVFDGDPDTKVVCEGYSKAFQYLCDLSTFDNAECYTVTGDCGGAHMWNIVKLDGKNYLVDVTNSDPDENDDGTVSVGADGSLFLKDPVAGGSVAQGYEFDTLATKNTKYTYGSDNIWGQDVLTLGAVAIVDDGNDVTYFQEFAKAAALWNSKNGSMLTLLNNCSSGQLYITGSNLILNLNKFTLTTTEKYYIFINVDGGSVSINGTGSIIGGSGAACLQNTKNGILTIVGDVTIGGQKKIDYTSGTIDLSRMANVEGLTIYASAAQSDMAKFILPEGYALCDASGNALDSLTSGTTATITTPVATTYVAEVDGTKYAEFSTALNAWKNFTDTNTLKLLDDVQITSVIKLDTYYSDKVLDLNGHQLSRTDGSIVLYITNGSINLTIQDSDSNGKIVATADRANLIENSGTLAITGGTFEAGNGIAIANYGKLNISGNTVISNNSENFVCVAYPTSISGNVQINGTVDIGFNKIPDLKTATNCKGWVVTNSGDAPAMPSPDEWLPDGYALEINGKIDYELAASATGTIVVHSTCDFSDWGTDEDEGYHWKACDCGRTTGYGPHDYTASHTSIDGTTHTAACACGATVTEPHTLGYTSAGNGTHDVTCTKNCGYSATAVPCTNVTYTANANDFRHTVHCNDCGNDNLEGCNVGTCPKCGAYGVIVDNKRLTSANAGNVLGDGKVSYDAAAQTLTLSNANTTYIDSNHDLTVTYSGNNTLSQYIGVSGKDLVLNATSGAKLTAASIGGSLTSNVTINGGAVYLSDAYNPIEAKNLTISNANVTAHASNSFVPTIDLAGKLTLDGNSHLKATRDQDGYAITFKGFEGNGYYRTAANGTFTKAESISVSTYIDGYYEYVGAEHLPKFVDDKNGATHSATCACGTTVTENHTYNANNVCTGCGVSNTVTITLSAGGAKIVEINGETKEILHGGTFTVPRGQDLTVKFENTLSKWETGVRVSAGTADYPISNFTYDEATNIMTIPASVVNQDLYVYTSAYVRVQFNLHGGTLTEDGEAEFNYVGHTWNAKNATLKAAGSLIFFEPEYFQLDGHTCAGAMVEGSDVVEKVALEVTGDATVDILWNCTDPTNTLTYVPAKAATCTEAGNIAYYICTCSKLYEDEAGTKELTAAQVKTDIDPDNHDFDPDTGVCTACNAVKTYTVIFNPYGDSGAKIVEINGEAKEISDGETFTAPHGQELTVKFENTLSQKETGVGVDVWTADYLVVNFTYNEATNTLTIPAVNQDLYVDATAYVHVQFNLHGGALTDDGRELLVERFGYTWDAEASTLKAGYGFNFALRPEYFQLAGHTLAGAKVVGSEEVVRQLSIRSDMTVDILWDCDGSTLTYVEAKAATCKEAGNIAHYICTCSKLYAEDKTTVLTSVTLPVDPTNHVGMDSTTGKCACGEDMAVAKVEFEGNTTYHETLKDLESGCYGTLTLLADCSYDGDAIQFWAEENVINLNGHTLESEKALSGAQGTLTIIGPGTVKGAGITGGEYFEKLIIGANVNLEGTNGYELLFQCGTFDLTQATIPENGWRIRAQNTGDGYGMYPTTFGYDDTCDVKMPEECVAFNTEGKAVTEAAYKTLVTIKAHTHEYVNGVCGCGVICNHVGMDPDTGLCPVCKLQHVASVTIGSETTYYKTLLEAMDAANEKTATITLLAECELNNNFAIAGGNVELRLNNQTITATQTLTVSNGATLTINGSGSYTHNQSYKDIVLVYGTLNINGGNFTATDDCQTVISSWEGTVNINGGTFTATGNQSCPVTVWGNVTVTGSPTFTGSSENGEFSITGVSTLDLSGVTTNMDGWCIWNNYATNGVVIGQTLKLPDDYALKQGEEFVTSLADDQIGTIVEHKEHDYVEAHDPTYHWTVCVCGATTEPVKHTFTYTPVDGQEVHIVGCSGCTYAAPEEIPHDFTNGECVCSATPVADVAGTQYANFANAVEAWMDGTTLTLLADVTHDNSIDFYGGSYTFVGGNYTLDLGNACMDISGALTIESGTIKTTEWGPIEVRSNASATINSDNTTLKGSDRHIAVQESARLTITGKGCDGWRILGDPWKAVPITIPEGFHLENDDGDQLDANDTLPAGVYTVIKADHNHNWSYQAEGATITATCSADGCPDAKQSVTVEAHANLLYDGTSKDATVSGSIDGADVTITYNDVDRVNVTGKDIVASITLGGATASVKYQVTPFSLTQTQIGSIADQTYTGAAIEPEISVTWADITLEKGTDYTVTYADNTNVGEATVTITGVGNYTGEKNAVFNITPASIEGATIPDIADQPYTGEEIKPEVTVTMGNKTLVEGTDYDVTYSNNVNVGTATVTATGKGNYTRTASTTFQITPADAVVSVNTYLDDEAESDFIYGQTITVKGQVAVASTTLSLRAKPTPNQVALYYNEVQISEPVTIGENGAYTLTYDTTDKAITPGSGIKLVVKYVGDNTTNMASAAGEVSITLATKPLSVTSATATSRTYDGTTDVAITEVTLDGVIEGDEVSVNVDGLKGTISSADASEYTTVTLPDALPLIGDHAAFYTAAGTTVNANVTISAKVVTVTDLTIELEPATFVYDGNAKKPAVTVKDGETIIDPSEYTVSYQNNTNVGTADAKPTVTITDNAGGNYTVSGTKEFTITQSASAVTAKSYLGDAEQDTFTYGQTITVKGQAAIDAAAQTFALRATPVNTAALYYGETKLAEATVAADNTFILTYDTTGKALPIGTSTLTVEFGGTGNLADESTTVAITLNAKSLTVTSATATSRTYDGTTDVAITEVTLDGVIEGDEVSVNVDGLKGTISSADAGEYTTVTLPEELPLIGDHAGFYTVEGATVNANVTISAKVVTVTDLTIELEPATFVYDGTAKEPAVTVKDGETVIAKSEYTVTYLNNTEVGDATVNIADAEGGNYTVSGSATFEITKGNSDLTAATYLNDVATTDFTYEDVITVKGQATLQQTFALRQVEINKAALFCGDVQLGEPVAVGEDGTYTLTYDTTGKGLAIGENTLTVVYGGSGNLAGQTATVKVTLNKADPEVNIPTDLTATYGQTLADVTLPDDFAWNDPTAPVGDAGSNTHKATFTPSDTDCYNTAEVDVSITVGKLALTGVTLPENMTLPTYCATADEAKAKLPETVAYTGEDGKPYTLPATWSCTDYNAAPDSESTFTWTVETPQTNFEFAEGVATTGTITVKNGTAVAVTITGTDTAITYDSNPYDVSAMFTIDENAGATTYSIVSNGTDTGAGTLEGSVLTITKAGTITIQANTAANTVEGMPYAPGEATAVLTVSKGTLNVTAPTGLTASYGDTLASVKLPADANGTWAWKDTSTETKVGDAGERTHKAIFTPTNTNLWEAVEVDVTITVTKAAIILDGVVKSYLVTAEGETETTEFTYGQTITVKAAPVMPAVLSTRSLTPPTPNQMALFIGSTQISAPADADANGVYTMTYQTTDKALAIGTSDILVKYIGTDNHESGILPLTVTLLPAELKVSSVTLKDRTYEPGNTQVEVTAATLSGILGTDEVLADTAKMLCILKADGAMSDKAGEYTEVILPETIPLTGAHASFYTAKGGTAINATVTITKATPEATGTPDMGDVTPGTQLKDVPTDAIEELYKPVEGTVTWDNPEETVEPGKEYDYTFTPDDTENYEPVEGSTVIIPLAPPQPEVPPVVLPTVIVPAEDQLVTVYEGETADMSVTAINADAYQWYINRNDGMGWRPIIGANTPAYTTSVTTLNDDGYLYLCRVSNADGAVNSPVFTLDVLPALDVPPTGDNAPVMLWASLLLMSAALMIMAGKKRRFN